MPRIKVDVVVLVVVVFLVLGFAPGHGAVGWILALAGAVLVGAMTGVAGRRYPGIYGQRRRHDRRS